ncbi:MAG: terminase [Edaphobacter sp.]|uniref:phage terminase large subunit family protein n=1 Tax=Edaphobacter sp. TaxID=1934404 RepID=UPI0023849556|nr:terminase [Edaphobacter sp.]MDE1176723.1 terminase [Edaphobacter sp.]
MQHHSSRTPLFVIHAAKRRDLLSPHTHTEPHLKDRDDLLDLGRRIRRGPHGMFKGLSEHIHVRDRNGQTQLLRANPAQRAFELARGDRSNIVLKARQMGITTWIAARLFLKTVTAPGVLTVQVAHTREAAEGIFRMVQRFWEHLPDEIRSGPLRRGRANIGQMTFPELDSEFRILSAGDPGAGRGLSIQNLHLSEVSQWAGDAAETLAGLRAALAPSGEIVIESTPRGAQGCFYDEWNRAPGNGTVQHFFPWWLEPAYISAAPLGKDPGDAPESTYTDEERRLVASHNLTPQQIGFRRSLESSFHRLRAQEYAEDAVSCFLSSGNCCFDTGIIQSRLDLAPPPVERRPDGLHLWLPPEPGRRYLLGVDTSGGGADGDFAAIQVIERETGLQCAELQHRLPPMQLAHAAIELAREYNQALIAVERNNHGAGVLAHIQNARYPALYATAGHQDDRGGQHGWLTSLATKPVMIARLNDLLAQSPQVFASERLLREMRSYITLPRGGTGAASGAHDDCVMAIAIAHAVRAELLSRR